MKLTLNHLRPGQTCVVLHIWGKKAWRKRLIEMGITPGVQIKVHKYAPLGDPMELHLRGYSLAIARSAAMQIQVKILFRKKE